MGLGCEGSGPRHCKYSRPLSVISIIILRAEDGGVPRAAFARHVATLTRYEPCLGLSRALLGLAALV